MVRSWSCRRRRSPACSLLCAASLRAYTTAPRLTTWTICCQNRWRRPRLDREIGGGGGRSRVYPRERGACELVADREDQLGHHAFVPGGGNWGRAGGRRVRAYREHQQPPDQQGCIRFLLVLSPPDQRRWLS